MARNSEGQSPRANNRQIEYNEIIRENIREGKIEDMESSMRTLARAAEEKLT